MPLVKRQLGEYSREMFDSPTILHTIRANNSNTWLNCIDIAT